MNVSGEKIGKNETKEHKNSTIQRWKMCAFCTHFGDIRTERREKRQKNGSFHTETAVNMHYTMRVSSAVPLQTTRAYSRMSAK